jgi:hypothetical protein
MTMRMRLGGLSGSFMQRSAAQHLKVCNASWMRRRMGQTGCFQAKSSPEIGAAFFY